MKKPIVKGNKIGITRRLLLLLCVLLAINSTSFSQQDSCSYTISGIILNSETQKPIPYATVNVDGTEQIGKTDKNGKFFIGDLCDKDPVILVNCFGFEDLKITMQSSSEEVPRYYLTASTTKLETFSIETEANKEEGTESISQVSIGQAEIKNDPTRSLADLVSDEQGVSLTSYGTNIQLPVIHGIYGNRVLVLNNGLKHGFQNWGTDHGPEVDISNAYRVTVVKGAAGVRYGPEALGGAISVENAPLHLNESFKVKLGTGYQTNGRGYFTNAEVFQGLKNWSYYIGANHTQIGDRHTPDYLLTNSGKIEQSVNGGVRYNRKDWDVNVYYSYLDQNLAVLRSSIASSGSAFVNAINADRPNFIQPFSYDINEPNQVAEHHLGKGELSWTYRDDAKIIFRYGMQLNKRKEYDVRRNSDKPIIDLDLITNDYQLEWKHPKWRKLNGLIGVQAFNQLNDNNPGTETTPFIPNYKTISYSGFIIESIKHDKTTYELGSRFDFVQNYVAGRETNQDIFFDEFRFSNITASIGIVRKFSENNSFRTNFGTAWRTPNMSELYSYGQHGFKSSFGLLRYYFDSEGKPNTNRVLSINESSVRPEKGYKLINELITKNDQSTHTTTVYFHYIQNYIFERPLTVIGTIRGPMPAFIFEQTDATFAGIDYSWEMDWTEQLSGTFGTSLLWSKNIEENEPLINQPPISVNYKLTYQKEKFWKFKSSQLSISPRYVFQQFQAPRTVTPEELIEGIVEINQHSEVFDFKDAPESYLLLDLSWRFKWNSLDIGISVNNALNARYRDYLNEMRYFADEMGRNFLFTLNYVLTPKTKALTHTPTSY